MKMKILTMVLLAALAAPVAQAQDGTSLLSVATGTQFNVGHTAFRMVPGVGLQNDPATPDSSSAMKTSKTGAFAAANASPDVLGTVGPYQIVSKPGGATASTASKASATAVSVNPGHVDVQDLGVAVNTRSGQAVAVAPRLKVFASKASDIAAAATQAGGVLVYASDADGSGLIRFASVEAAQAALAGVQRAHGVQGANLDVIEQFRQKM